MKKTKLISLILAVLMVISMIPFSAVSAAEASIQVIDGERTALVNSFGKMSYNGKAYVTYKNFTDAFNALGAEGGTILFTGSVNLPDFKDIEGRGPITIQGIGTKAMTNILNFSGSNDAPVSEVNLKGDTYFDFLNIRLAENAFLYTNGNSLETVNEFDTYHSEQYVENGPNIMHYPNPPSVAPGEVKEGTSSIFLNAGTYKNLVAGSANGKNVNGNSYVALQGGTVETVVGGNMGNGTINGNAKLTIGEGNITKLVAGSLGGTVNGNVYVTIGGGEIAEVVFGAESGATINGSVVVALNGGNFGGKFSVGKGTVTGKKIIIAGSTATIDLADIVAAKVADVIVNIDGGFVDPQFEGTAVSGYLITDEYGIPVTEVVINGASATSETGVYQLADGLNTIKVESKVAVKVNKNASYVAGYEDGTFLPQKNITRAEAITLLTRTVTDENNIKGKVKADYEDVESGAWYESYIGLFQKLGFLDTISGKHGALIMPTQPITRGEFVELIYNVSLLGEPSTSVKIKNFTDVNVERYPYVGAINYAVTNGIVTGYEDGTFKPDNPITRAEVVTIVNRFLGRTPTGVAGTVNFSDIASHWANGQILAACNAEGVSWTAAPEQLKYQITGTKAEDYIKALYEQSSSLTADAIREGVDVIAEQMKKDILNSPNTMDIYGSEITGKVYYVSEKNGNDENDGLSPETAWKTFEGMRSKLRFPKLGVAVLFERGGIYRGQLSGTNNVIYGAYGEGHKPLIIQSAKNYADPSLWEQTEYENVWKLKEELVNVGVIGFDHDLYDYSENAYNETYGLIMNKGNNGFDGAHELCGDLQFYSDISAGVQNKGPLYLYSAKGNPGERFTSIEIGERKNITGGAKNVVYDNLAMKFTGAHAIGMGTVENIRVTNCVFSWIGGSVLSINEGGYCVNYGNAVESYGGCDGYRVENCWMYQIYDTGVTHQRSSSTGNNIQKGVRYIGNLIEYVFWGIEFYNAPPTAAQLGGAKDTYKRITEDVRSEFNVLRMGGYGWGSIVRFRTCSLYCGSTLSENKDCYSEYNIIDRGTGNLLHLPSNSNEKPDKNIYIQTYGKSLGNLKGYQATCTYNAAALIEKYWGDKNAVVIVIDPEREPVVVNKPEGLQNGTL